MKILHISPNSWGSNCYLLVNAGGAFAIDPGAAADSIPFALAREKAVLKGIILTHGHFDHVLTVDPLKNSTGAPVMIHAADNEMLSDPEQNGFLSVLGCDRAFAPADVLLSDGEVLSLGEETIEVIHTPGHSRGSICLLCGDILLTGDTLFSDGFGRIDFFGGSLNEMKQSLLRLKELDPNTKIYPGHGESTTLGDALATIRFLNR